MVPLLILVRRENHLRRLKKNRHAPRPRRRRQGGLDYKVAAWLAVTAGGSPGLCRVRLTKNLIFLFLVLDGRRAFMIHSELSE